VESKLRQFLIETPKPREPRVKKPGKWDAIMDRIERNKQPLKTPRHKTSQDLDFTPGVGRSKLRLSRDNISIMSRESSRLSRDGSMVSREGSGLSRTLDLSTASSQTSNNNTSNISNSNDLSPRSDRGSLLGSSPKRKQKLGNKENQERSFSSLSDRTTAKIKKVFRSQSTSDPPSGSTPSVHSSSSTRTASVHSSTRTAPKKYSVLSPKNVLSPTSSEKSFRVRKSAIADKSDIVLNISEDARDRSLASDRSHLSDKSHVSDRSLASDKSLFSEKSDVVNDEKLKQRSFSSSSSQSRASISSRKNSSTLSKVATVPPRRSTVSRPAVPSKPLTKPSTKPLNNNTTATTAAANRQNENNRKNAKISKTSRGENRGIGEQPDLLKDTIWK